MAEALHEEEIAVDVGLVRGLVRRDLPERVDAPVRRLPVTGSSNWLFRLGEDLLVRLPRQPGGSAALLKESRWLPRLQPRLPVEVPSVVHVGAPSPEYPEHWSVARWVDGDTVSAGCPGDRETDLAHDLAGVVGALRAAEPPPEALADPALRGYRGGPLADLDAGIHEDIVACRTLPGLELDLDLAARVWREAVALSRASGTLAPRWLHGDLLAENLLVREGRLVGVLDFGGLGVGDPTVDLVVAWEVLGRRGREEFRRLVGVEESAWLLGRGWALGIALMTFPYYWRTMPERCADRLVMARAVLADADAS